MSALVYKLFDSQSKENQYFVLLAKLQNKLNS